MPSPFTSAGQPDKPIFLSSTETSSIVVEKKDEITASLGASNSSRQIDSSSRSLHDAADAAGLQSADVAGNHDATAGLPAGTDAIKNTAQVVRSLSQNALNRHRSMTNVPP